MSGAQPMRGANIPLKFEYWPDAWYKIDQSGCWRLLPIALAQEIFLFFCSLRYQHFQLALPLINFFGRG